MAVVGVQTTGVATINNSPTTVVVTWDDMGSGKYYKVTRAIGGGTASDLTSWITGSDDPDSDKLFYSDTTASQLEGSPHRYRVITADDDSGTNAGTPSNYAEGYILAVTTTALLQNFTPISIIPFNYTASGGTGIWRLRKAQTSILPSENFVSKRQTKWFPLSNYEKDAKIRRLRISYKSNESFWLKIYADYSTVPSHILSIPQSVDKTLEYQKATLRAKLIMVEISTQRLSGHFLEIYGMEIETDV